MMRKLGTVIRNVFLIAILAGATVWGSLALFYSELESYHSLNVVLAVLFALAGLATAIAIALRYRRMLSAGFFLSLFVALLVWWNGIKPSNDRDWRPDVALLARAEIHENLVTFYNIRNFDYRSETDYTPNYYDKTFDLNKLHAVDLVAVYWMGPAIAHTFLSFGFEDGDHLAVSIETRMEKTESYSTVKGFFKQYELYYVVADERDVIRLRTNYRKNPPEDVYIYRAQAPIKNGKRLFLEYLHKINALNESPEFYNTLVDNCTTGIWMNTRINPGHVPFSWKVLASGYLPEYLYEAGKLDASLSFEELRRRSYVNVKAQAADQAEDFSRLIRSGLPGIKPVKP